MSSTAPPRSSALGALLRRESNLNVRLKSCCSLQRTCGVLAVLCRLLGPKPCRAVQRTIVNGTQMPPECIQSAILFDGLSPIIQFFFRTHLVHQTSVSICVIGVMPRVPHRASSCWGPTDTYGAANTCNRPGNPSLLNVAPQGERDAPCMGHASFLFTLDHCSALLLPHEVLCC